MRPPRAANITPSPPCPAEVPAAMAKFTPHTPSIQAHHVGILLLSCTPAYRKSCESARKPPLLSVPFLSLYSVKLLPFISTQLPNYSVALPLSFCSSFSFSNPSQAHSHPPSVAKIPCLSTSFPCTLIPRAWVSGGRRLRLIVGNGEGTNESWPNRDQ